MVRSKILRCLFLVWSAVFIIFILQCHISETVWFSSQKELREQKKYYTAEISAKELDTFIRYWPEYNKLALAQDMNISYKTELPSRFSDWKTRMWFVYHHLDINRFFYVQQRVISLLRTIETRRRAEALIEEFAASKKKIAIEMVDLQKKILKAEKIDDIEFLIVSAREEKLKELFRQYP